MPNQKDTELESILTEINSDLKKGKAANTSNPKKEGAKPKKVDTVADTYEEEPKTSFIQTAKIIEENPDPEELLTDRKSRHIQVAAEEKGKKDKQEDTVPQKPEKARESEKKVSKGELKRTNGTAVSRPQERKKTVSKKQKKLALLGILIAFFVVVGAVSTVWSVVGFTHSLVNETALKEELVKEIFPLVIVDVPEFESSVMLDNSAIIASSIWAFIIDEEDKTMFQKDDFGSIYVPDVDIEKYIRRLYGSDVKITHQSVDDSSVQMTYNPETKYYVIESTPKFLPYTPRIDKISKSKDILTLRVSYVLPDAMWNLKTNKKDQVVDKVMEYTVKKNDKSYQMISVKLIEVTTHDSNPIINNQDELTDENVNQEGISADTPTATTPPGEATSSTTDPASSATDTASK